MEQRSEVPAPISHESAADAATLRRAFEGDFEAIHALAHRSWDLVESGEVRRGQLLLEALTTDLERLADDNFRAKGLAFFALGTAYQYSAQYQRAGEAFCSAEIMLRDEQSDRSLWLASQANRALSMAQSGIDPAEIASNYDSVLCGPEPEDPEPIELLSLALLSHACERIEQAKRYWGMVLADERTTAPDWCAAALGLAIVEIAEGQLQAAEDRLNQIRINHGSEQTGKSFLMVAADLSSAKKDWATAQRQLKEALHQVPDDAEVTFRLGVCSTSRQNYEEAEKWFARSVAASPTLGKAQAALARVQVARGADDSQAFGRIRVKYRALIAALLVVFAIMFISYPIFTGASSTSDIQSVVTCDGPTNDQRECPPGTQTSMVVTKKDAEAPIPHEIPNANLLVSGVLAAAAFVILVAPNFSKIHLGPMDLEQASPAPPVPVAGRGT